MQASPQRIATDKPRDHMNSYGWNGRRQSPPRPRPSISQCRLILIGKPKTGQLHRLWSDRGLRTASRFPGFAVVGQKGDATPVSGGLLDGTRAAAPSSRGCYLGNTIGMCIAPTPIVLVTDDTDRIAAPIFTSVGQDAVNAPGDVFVIQSLLNRRLPRPHVDIPVTGDIDLGTVLAIKTFQAMVMNMNPPTGHVAPGSATYTALAALPSAIKKPLLQAQFGHVGIVPPNVIEAAKASHARWGVPASVILAQWIVESAWGSAMPPDSNNPFGIKALESQPAVESQTREVVDGKTITITAKFRRFANVGEAFEAHGRLLGTASPYQAARTYAQDPERFADALTGVYATDPQYGEKLKWAMENYKLKQHNVSGAHR